MTRHVTFGYFISWWALVCVSTESDHRGRTLLFL